eukprot:5012597-Amphidinium_carterae.1
MANFSEGIGKTKRTKRNHSPNALQNGGPLNTGSSGSTYGSGSDMAVLHMCTRFQPSEHNMGPKSMQTNVRKLNLRIGININRVCKVGRNLRAIACEFKMTGC